MDTNCLKEHYHSNSYNNVYADIKTVLSKHGFNNIQGSVYLGNEGVSEAHGTIAIQELTARFDWFYSCVSNIRFYRLESDLDAQFIADNVHSAKQKYLNRIEQLKKSLIEAGLDNDKVNQVLKQQSFELGDLKLPLKLNK